MNAWLISGPPCQVFQLALESSLGHVGHSCHVEDAAERQFQHDSETREEG